MEYKYKIGQLIKIGVADDSNDESGYSVFTKIDVQVVSESEIRALFPRNVLYIQDCDDKQSKEWAKENPISKLMS